MGVFGWFWKRPAPPPLYSVISEDHVRLYQIFGELRQAIGSRGDNAASREGKRKHMLEVVQRLMTECDEHFLREEALMVLHNYAGLEHHRSEHRLLRRNVQGYYSRLASGRAPITEDVSQFFKAWLTTHIRTTDRELERFLFSVCKDRDIHGQFAPGHTDMSHFAAMVEQLRAARAEQERAG
jgi:hemerythrin